MSAVNERILFSNQKLKRLIIPLIIEQFLSVMIGITDTLMVSAISESAVSGVALVDAINVLLIQVFSALATGGAVVIAQAIGNQDNKQARDSAKQLVYVITLISSVIMIVCLIWSQSILLGIFGQVDQSVMLDANIFFRLSALSFPFLAIYNACAAIFRAMGNSKAAMFTALIMNGVNILGNVIFIFIFKMGVEGSALSTLISRAFAAVVMLVLIANKENQIYVRNLLKFEYHGTIIRKMLSIGIPNGLENGMFQVGKLLVQRLIANLGVAAIAANAIGNSVVTFISIPAGAISLAIITVTGQCIGAHYYKQAINYTKKLMLLSVLSFVAFGLVFFVFADQIVGIYNLSPDASSLAVSIIKGYCIFAILAWVPSFNLPNALRAGGDAKFTMIVSIVSMWLCRIVCSYIFVIYLNLGVLGIWWAMYLDWGVRAVVFEIRFRRERWMVNALV